MPVTAIVSAKGTGASAWIPLTLHETPFNASFGVVVQGGTVNYRVEHTFDDIFDPDVSAVAFTHEDVSANSGSADGNYAFPVRAVRLNVTVASANASIRAIFLQSGN